MLENLRNQKNNDFIKSITFLATTFRLRQSWKVKGGGRPAGGGGSHTGEGTSQATSGGGVQLGGSQVRRVPFKT